MSIIAIDLGTTNIKVGYYSDDMQMLTSESVEVKYIREGVFVEFDPCEYFNSLAGAISRCAKGYSGNSVSQIVLTGQAESLVVLNGDGNPLCNGISWLDNRSEAQCVELKEKFDSELCYKITGQPEVIPTWPITKMLWLKQNSPEVFNQAAHYLMLKDYIQYRLTGKMYGELSIYNFTHYFDITKKCYWDDILDYVGIRKDQLPELVEPCTDIGEILPEMHDLLSIENKAHVNVGTLDHFAGMIGTGNIRLGTISESTGTVMSIATMVDAPRFNEYHVGCHYGPFKNSYVMLAICESGGISLEWFKRQCMGDTGYAEISEALKTKSINKNLLFLPYVNGTNAPDFNPDALGVFYGLDMTVDKFDMAYAVMEGVSHMLAQNIEFFDLLDIRTTEILATGGGARSDAWSQLKADITGKVVAVPDNEEAACLGAAMIGAVAAGIYPNFDAVISKCVSIKKRFEPKESDVLRKKHAKYIALYDALRPVFSER